MFISVVVYSCHNAIDLIWNFFLFQSEEGTSQLRIKILSGQSLAKKDIFGAR